LKKLGVELLGPLPRGAETLPSLPDEGESVEGKTGQNGGRPSSDEFLLEVRKG
jgi:hypothetical protein